MKRFLKLLRRVPDAIILEVAGQTFAMSDFARCVCGHTLRATVRALTGRDAQIRDEVTLDHAGNIKEARRLVTGPLSAIYGGTVDEWDALFYGVTNNYVFDEGGTLTLRRTFSDTRDHIEEAFARRVAECV